jgi:hypothetical protein
MSCPPPRRRPGARRHAGRPRLPAAVILPALLLGAPATGAAQSLDDGLLVPRRQLRTTVEYGVDRWDEYWEGTLRRTNGNIGTLTTRSVAVTGAYGVTDRLSVVATLPYVWTEASQGVLHGMRGAQDVTVAAKYRLPGVPVAGRTTVAAVVTAGVGAPATDYTPDFLPLSIGLASRRALARVALRAQDRAGAFVEGTAGRAWRSNVRLDRPAYYTDGRLVLSDEVEMPDVFDWSVSAGWQNGRLSLPVTYSAQRTLGGGDIRRQDMPFVSNRMDFTRLGARAMYALPVAAPVAVHVGAVRTLSGRNVGRSTSITGGVTYAVRL